MDQAVAVAGLAAAPTGGLLRHSNPAGVKGRAKDAFGKIHLAGGQVPEFAGGHAQGVVHMLIMRDHEPFRDRRIPDFSPTAVA